MDIEKAEDPQVHAVADVIISVSPDIVLLTSFDYDYHLKALSAFAGLLDAKGRAYPHIFALHPNKGMLTPLDLDGDGELGGPGDAQGFGYFAGQGGMALLSRFPIDQENVQDYSAVLWSDFPDALLPSLGGEAFPSEQALRIQRLSTTGHWVVPVILPDGHKLDLMAWHATPPVFDGPEDRNGRRNHDETIFWRAFLDGEINGTSPQSSFVVLGDANLDPYDGDGIGEAMLSLLTHPKIHDPKPDSQGGEQAAELQAGANLSHKGPARFDTVDWRDENGPGNLRVDYVLPSADLSVEGAGVYWPPQGHEMYDIVESASPHRLVWVDIGLPE